MRFPRCPLFSASARLMLVKRLPKYPPRMVWFLAVSR
jgi:hypothetical protein